MATTRIKICGINAANALEAAIGAHADFAGFVFYPPSPRALTPREAAPLGERAQGRIKRVGLFVDAEDDLIAEAVAAAGLDALQLHGTEAPGRAAALKARFDLPVWKALPVASSDDIERAKLYREAADLILFDAKTPKGTLPGGMGLRFDWTLLASYRSPIAWGVAGGIGPDNVAEALAITSAPLVDVSSGVESEPGVKDVDKIAAFCKAARNVG
ncbi:phosphoribosylanthranilate isomerase [Croceicoccus naphthovorans]|uniref:N-(5'-phosphoribosyl)anthranilate isomerase n=1 Tax=Croceicoccus naphthovorans TaxID=1348774 RepID=A0A0G3XDR1_9SPHN|nr:phosphoribosylanthranilate isomerase [Croceicoccus naphthovorans]AKM09670.1 N-(5'-phosphoribosyl)anthranilate isomerase [Croceicoccus naphthovorans]MBB3990793.1 phosphoribosylanthranilate isomerase [Croceicoccus naphthovorans]